MAATDVNFSIASGQPAEQRHHQRNGCDGHQREMPCPGSIMHFPHQRRPASRQQIANGLRHARERRGLVRRAGAQPDKGQPQNHRRTGAETENHRPQRRLRREYPVTQSAHRAHQRDGNGDPSLILEAMQDQRNSKTGRGGCQLEQSVQRASLRFAVALTH